MAVGPLQHLTLNPPIDYKLTSVPIRALADVVSVIWTEHDNYTTLPPSRASQTSVQDNSKHFHLFIPCSAMKWFTGLQ